MSPPTMSPLEQVASLPLGHDCPSPSVTQIKEIHIYDFDQTLYASPLPNAALYTPGTLNHLRFPNTLANGGWFECPDLLEYSIIATNRPRESKWNMKVCALAAMSLADEHVLAIVLTGRREDTFSGVFKLAMDHFMRDIGPKRPFDAVCLKKPHLGTTTMQSKLSVIKTLLDHYSQATQVRVYEDRESQARGFKRFFKEYIESNSDFRPQLCADVVMVSCDPYYLDPEVELELVMRMVQQSNETVDRTRSGQKYTLSKSLQYSGFKVDACTLKLIQHEALKQLKKKNIPQDVIESLNWRRSPVIPLDSENPQRMVSSSRLYGFLNAFRAPDEGESEFMKKARDIKKGLRYEPYKWNLADFFYESTQGYLGFILTDYKGPVQLGQGVSVMEDYAILLAGPGTQDFLTDDQLDKILGMKTCVSIDCESTCFQFNSYLGVYFIYRLKNL